MARIDLNDIRLSPAAQDDLEKIWLYSAENWSTAQTTRYTASIKNSLERLLSMPELAPERTEFNPPVRIYSVANHLIVYRISGDFLDVLRILGGRQDWHSLLRVIES